MTHARRLQGLQSGMTTYRISDAARRTGLPTSTLRYYERIGLLPAPERTDSGYRAYEERALDRRSGPAREPGHGFGRFSPRGRGRQMMPTAVSNPQPTAPTVAATHSQAKASPTRP